MIGSASSTTIDSSSSYTVAEVAEVVVVAVSALLVDVTSACDSLVVGAADGETGVIDTSEATNEKPAKRCELSMRTAPSPLRAPVALTMLNDSSNKCS